MAEKKPENTKRNTPTTNAQKGTMDGSEELINDLATSPVTVASYSLILNQIVLFESDVTSLAGLVFGFSQNMLWEFLGPLED